MPHPKGASSILLKSNTPKRWACADTVGVELDCRSRFTVNSAWGSSLSQSDIGKEGLTPARMEMKWFLKILMPASVMFLL